MSIRTQLLDAAESLLREKGLSALTTREIAKRASCAEGSIYKNFGSRIDLLLAMVKERIPDLSASLVQLAFRVGENSVEENLQYAFLAMLAFYRQATPFFSAVLLETELRASARKSLKAEDAGPHRWRQPVEAYLRAEQRLGRVASEIDAGDAAALLLARAFQHAFNGLVFGDGGKGADSAIALSTVATLIAGLARRTKSKPR
jgi:AcrR family transcriptional regulator